MMSSYPTDISEFPGAVHFVGIGGAGMSGIAEVLVNLGCTVQGSDIVDSALTQYLKSLGVKVFIGHRVENIDDAEVVVISSAITSDNPELCVARERKIPVMQRAEMLAELMRSRFGISVAGTHGKTTTTSLIATVLSHADLDPTYVVGGKVEGFGRAGLGASEYLVVEANESDASFLHLKPMMAVVTNIDADHLGSYGHSFEALKDSFIQFITNLPIYGIAVVCNEDPVLRELQETIPRRFLTYGFSKDCDIYASRKRTDGVFSFFELRTPWSEQMVEVCLSLPGDHNILNALAAIGIAYQLDADQKKVYAALEKFRGVQRRFQSYGEIPTKHGNVRLIDDYGHHPTEISATYATVCDAWPRRRKILIFQPHRYSRLDDLFDEFSSILARVDLLLLLDTYPAGEQEIPGVNTSALCQKIFTLKGVRPIHIRNLEEVAAALEQVIQDDDILITMGAGSISKLAEQLADELRCNDHAA